MRASKDFRSVAYGHPKRITTPATNFLRPAVGALGLVVGLMALGAAPPATAQPRYTITDLGTLGGSYSNANGINNLGQVVGTSGSARVSPHAFRTAPNSPINPATDDLGTLGGCYSAASGINSSGQVVGNSTNTCVAGDLAAFRTAPNSPINPARTSSEQTSLPASTTPAKWLVTPTSSPSRATDDLGNLGIQNTSAYGINNAGQVVGSSITAARQGHAFRTAPKSPINPATDDLGTLGGCPVGTGFQARLPSLQQRIRY